MTLPLARRPLLRFAPLLAFLAACSATAPSPAPTDQTSSSPSPPGATSSPSPGEDSNLPARPTCAPGGIKLVGTGYVPDVSIDVPAGGIQHLVQAPTSTLSLSFGDDDLELSWPYDLPSGSDAPASGKLRVGATTYCAGAGTLAGLTATGGAVVLQLAPQTNGACVAGAPAKLVVYGCWGSNP